MAFDKVDTQVDLAAQERDVLRFWDQIQAFEKLCERNRGQPKWWVRRLWLACGVGPGLGPFPVHRAGGEWSIGV